MASIIKQIDYLYREVKCLKAKQSVQSGTGGGGAGGSGDKHLTYIQPAELEEWVIEHNLDKYPSTVIVDDNEVEVEASIQHITRNKLIITFTPGFSGKAYLN